MFRKNSPKKALVASILMLAICITSLVGTTFAWFTDSVSSAGNVIQTGTLNVELYYQKEGESSWTKVESDTNVFLENALWEPGHTEIIRLKIVNEGNLALKYRLGVNVAEQIGSKNVNGVDFMLSDYIKYGITEGALDCERAEAVAAVDSVSNWLSEAYISDMVKLLPKTEANPDNEDIVTMVVYMPESVGNDANHAFGEPDPMIKLGINLVAIQESFESDSFDEKYDENLDPVISYMGSGAALHNSTTQSGKFALSSDIKTSESDTRYGYGYEYIIRKGADYTLDFGGRTIVHDTVNKNASNTALTYLFVANHAGTKLTLEGDGKIYCGNSEGYTCAIQGKDGTLVTVNGGDFLVNNGIGVWSGAGAHVVINGGSFANENGTTNHELIYSSGGVIDIYGGFFHNKDGYQVLNVEDRNRATGFINVYGGTYVNFDPRTGGQDPNNIKVADGYDVKVEPQENGDTWYTVFKIPTGYEVVSTEEEALDALSVGKNIVLGSDISINDAVTVTEEANIDLNGCTLTVMGLNFTKDATIENGTIASGGNTVYTPHLKVTGGNLTMTDVTVDVNHHLNLDTYWSEAIGMEFENATAVLNNCDITVNNKTGAHWVFSYALSIVYSDVTLNGGSITATCVKGTAPNGPENPNGVSAIGASSVTLNNVDVSAMYYGSATRGHFTINTTDKNITSADIVRNSGGSFTINYID